MIIMIMQVQINNTVITNKNCDKRVLEHFCEEAFFSRFEKNTYYIFFREIFAFFVSKQNAKTKRKVAKKKNFAKNAKFLRNDFSFSLETLESKVLGFLKAPRVQGSRFLLEHLEYKLLGSLLAPVVQRSRFSWSNQSSRFQVLLEHQEYRVLGSLVEPRKQCFRISRSTWSTRFQVFLE